MRGPSHPDEKEDAFPTNFILACPATAQLQYLTPYRCTLTQFFAPPKDAQDIWFYSTFAKPIPGATRTQRHFPKPGKSLTRLEYLPTELLEIILDALLVDVAEKLWPNMHSVLALALSSAALYPKILARIHRDYARSRVCWAAKSVGFYGAETYIAPEQIPGWDPDPENWRQYDVLGGSGEKWFEPYQTVRGAGEDVWGEVIEGVRSGWGEIDDRGWEDVKSDLSQAYLYDLGDQGVWVLRNLSTKEIVRADKVVPTRAILANEELLTAKVVKSKWHRLRDTLYRPKVREKENKPLEPLTLPQIFLCLTAHTTCLNWFTERSGFTIGPWAIHAFDLVPLDDHLAQSDGDWTDVSAQVAADIGHLRWCIEQKDRLIDEIRNGRGRREWSALHEGVEEWRKEWTGWREGVVVKGV